MKKNLLKIFFLVFMNCLVFAAETKLNLVMSDSTKETVCIDSDAKSLILFSSETNKLGGKYIKSVEGIEKLSKIEEAEIYGLYMDFSFLNKLNNLKYLHISGCTISSLSFLEDMENLEVLELDFHPVNKLQIINEDIDLSKNRKLKRIDYTARLGVIPKFKNIRSQPELNLMNNNICEINKDDFVYLKQYSKINLRFNPIEDNAVVVETLSKLLPMVFE